MRKDRFENENMQIRAGLVRDLAAIVDTRVLRLFGRMERMDEGRFMEKVMDAEISGRKLGHQGWLDGWCED